MHVCVHVEGSLACIGYVEGCFLCRGGGVAGFGGMGRGDAACPFTVCYEEIGRVGFERQV